MHEILINRLVKLAQGNKSWLIDRLDVTAVDRDLKTTNQTHTYGSALENVLLITYFLYMSSNAVYRSMASNAV